MPLAHHQNEGTPVLSPVKGKLASLVAWGQATLDRACAPSYVQSVGDGRTGASGGGSGLRGIRGNWRERRTRPQLRAGVNTARGILNASMLHSSLTSCTHDASSRQPQTDVLKCW